ncbi:MAG: glycosyltransferase family 2 protein, partial [Hydrogenimonas sp.]|nr:glycosyltransferase family 2 protein [Hydrogenimonas sp.]
MVEKVSVTILTKDSEKYLEKCLEALREFNEIIILDNGSKDSTLKIASKFDNVKIIKHDFIGFGPLKNLAANKASNDWIFSVDSDEIATKELIESIKKIDPEKREVVYAISRLNHYKKKAIKCCGWYPDIVMRIYNKSFTQFSEAIVHESLCIPDGAKKATLDGDIKHYPFDSVESLIDKMQSYSTLYANQSNKPSSAFKAFTRALFAFFKNYILQRGFLCGYEGLLISVSNANGVFYKYMKLYE